MCTGIFQVLLLHIVQQRNLEDSSAAALRGAPAKFPGAKLPKKYRIRSGFFSKILKKNPLKLEIIGFVSEYRGTALSQAWPPARVPCRVVEQDISEYVGRD